MTTATGVQLRERLANVEQRIEEACKAVGRDSESVTLITVTKFHPASLVRELAELGVRDVGENRHQEAQSKSAELADVDVRWHFIGQLQTKKARQAARYAHSIHSIDRIRLVEALRTAEVETPIDAFLQVNLTEDPARGGVPPKELEPLAESVLDCDTLRLRGVMAVAPLDEDPRPAFERLADYSARVQKLDPSANAISAGMSHDFREALEFGATHLRIGSAITGNRPDPK